MLFGTKNAFYNRRRSVNKALPLIIPLNNLHVCIINMMQIPLFVWLPDAVAASNAQFS
jgi:hypothetical protein